MRRSWKFVCTVAGVVGLVSACSPPPERPRAEPVAKAPQPAGTPAVAAAPTAAPNPIPQNRLPQDHDYQRALRAYLGSLTEGDYAVEQRPFVVPAANIDNDGLCRLWVLSQHLPPIGGASSPTSGFTLAAIEGEKSVMRPPADALTLAWLAGWDDPMNPYRGSLGLKRRALATAIVDLIMTDGLDERSPGKDWVPYGLQTGIREGRSSHSDCLGGTLIWLGYAYLQCRDALPPDARKAYETGLNKMVRRLNAWGPTSLMTDMDLFSSVSLGYIDQASKDPEIKRIAEAYARNLYTDPAHFSRTGYWVDIQGYDASYNGISFYFADWSALATRWDFVVDAVTRAYRLKAHLALPEPGGELIGPSHFSPRTSFDSAHDQWGYPHRNTAGSLITDEAAYLVDVPTDEVLKGMPAKVAADLTASAASGAKAGPTPWAQRHWTGEFNFGFAHYPTGYYDRRRKLEKEHPELLKPPFARGERFVKQFGDDFVIARFADYGLVIHTGPVGVAEPDWPERAKWMPREKPFGFSGGSLSAFWTPTGGSLLLGRRGGAQGEVYDRYDQWRLWPFHAVTGETSAGKTFTSGRILRPTVKSDVGKERATIDVEGVIPRTYAGQGDALVGDIRYQRRFEARESGLRIETRIRGDGKDTIAELCETIPVFIASSPPPDSSPSKQMGPVEIRFRRGDAWAEGGAEYQDNVEAVRVKRFTQTIEITFEKPQRVKLSPANWTDQYQSRATCRTILIDLLRGDPARIKETSVAYTIAVVKE
ncbi:MAG: hypothetical protein NTW19_11215 [Planctomycetota bacterium]|nr:hypothetical protein [Planctomycetota bacterium]